MTGNGLNIIKKSMINYFPKSKMAAQSVWQSNGIFRLNAVLRVIYNVSLDFWNLIEVQINNAVDAALAPFKDFCYRAKSKMAAI